MVDSHPRCFDWHKLTNFDGGFIIIIIIYYLLFIIKARLRLLYQFLYKARRNHIVVIIE